MKKTVGQFILRLLRLPFNKCSDQVQTDESFGVSTKTSAHSFCLCSAVFDKEVVFVFIIQHNGISVI